MLLLSAVAVRASAAVALQIGTYRRCRCSKDDDSSVWGTLIICGFGLIVFNEICNLEAGGGGCSSD